MRGREYFFNVEEELDFLEGLITDGKVVAYQQGDTSYEVILENVEWVPVDAFNSSWEWDGTAIVTARSIT